MAKYNAKELQEIVDLLVTYTRSNDIKWTAKSGGHYTTKFCEHSIEFGHAFKDDYYNDYPIIIGSITYAIGGKKNKNALLEAIKYQNTPRINLLDALRNIEIDRKTRTERFNIESTELLKDLANM